MVKDQASALRDLLSKKNEPPRVSARVITVTSGKGGVGKSNFAVNLAVYLSQKNLRVVIIDADFGLANIEVLFGIVPRYTLVDVFNGDLSIEGVISRGPLGIKFLSGGSGFKQLNNISESQLNFVMKGFTYIDSIADIILIDTGAGINHSVVNFVKASSEAIVMTTPEPTSITDAYALIKTICEEKANIPDFKIIMNRVDDNNEGKEIFDKLNMVANRFLSVPLTHLGNIFDDPALTKAVKRQQPAMLMFPNCLFSKCVEGIGETLITGVSSGFTQQPGIISFMKRLVTIFGN